MSRKKPPINEAELIEGLSFSDTDNIPEPETQPQQSSASDQPTLNEDPDSAQTSKNKYYKQHPKVGKRGGRIGRPITDNPKITVSITCTKEQKALYKEAAEKDHRKFPDFVNLALQEYIDRHNLN